MVHGSTRQARTATACGTFVSFSAPRQTDGRQTEHIMPIRFEQHGGPSGCGLAVRVKAGQPAFAWDDLKAEYPNPDGVNGKVPANEASSAEDEDVLRDPRNGQAAFYDREALREQIKALQDENRDLSKKEVDLGLRLAKAQATLSGMRTKKRALSEEKILDEAASVVLVKGKAGAHWGEKCRDSDGDDASKRHEARDQHRQEEANVSNDARLHGRVHV